MHSRSKTEIVPPLHCDLEALRAEIISYPEELKHDSVASSARTDTQKPNKAPFSNTIVHSKLGKTKKSVRELLPPPPLSARTSKHKRGKSPQKCEIGTSRQRSGKGPLKSGKK